jgi:eukaryotic-like serine/threonine-protein kinase
VVKRRVGRYVVFEAFARGGMATVHLGRLIADRGFSRLVAVKMAACGVGTSGSSLNARALEEEARIASRIRHPNVVQPLDFVVDGDDLFVVMEYVHGVAFSKLLAASPGIPMPTSIVVAIVADVLKGLHAAHEAVDEQGRQLGVVHRDVSPHNVLVGVDGIARLADFGIAKVMRSTEHTATGFVKGKLSYMPPEQLRGFPLTRQADIFSAGAVLAEALSGFSPDRDDDRPTAWIPMAIARIEDPALLEVASIATKADARERYATAAEMMIALTAAVAPGRADAVAERVIALAGDELDLRTELVRSVEAAPLDDGSPEKASERVNLDPHAPPLRPSSSPPNARRRRRSPPRRALLFLAGAAIAMVAAVAWARFTKATTEAAPPPVWPVMPRAVVAPVESETPTAPNDPPPTSAPVVTPRLKSPRVRASARPLGPDCKPPFRIDADGKKHYRPECLE